MPRVQTSPVTTMIAKEPARGVVPQWTPLNPPLTVMGEYSTVGGYTFHFNVTTTTNAGAWWNPWCNPASGTSGAPPFGLDGYPQREEPAPPDTQAAREEQLLASLLAWLDAWNDEEVRECPEEP